MFEAVFVSFWGSFWNPESYKMPPSCDPKSSLEKRCPNFGFGLFFVNFRPPWILESELLARARCSFAHFHPFAVFWTSGANQIAKMSLTCTPKSANNLPTSNFGFIVFVASFLVSIFDQKWLPKWDPLFWCKTCFLTTCFGVVFRIRCLGPPRFHFGVIWPSCWCPRAQCWSHFGVTFWPLKAQMWSHALPILASSVSVRFVIIFHVRSLRFCLFYKNVLHIASTPTPKASKNL